MKPKPAKDERKKQPAVKLKDLKPSRNAKGGAIPIPDRIATNHNETLVSGPAEK